MSSQPSIRARGKRPERPDQTLQYHDDPSPSPSPSPPPPSADRVVHNGPKDLSVSNKVLEYLLFKHGIDLGLIGWASCIAATINVGYAIKSFFVSSDISRAALTQTALANQIAFLKMCLDYPQLGAENSSSSSSSSSSLMGMQLLFQKVPCENFLRALDFDAMARVLVDARMVPDIRSPPRPHELGKIKNDFDSEVSFVEMLKDLFGIFPSFFTAEAWKFMAAFMIFWLALAVGFTLSIGIVGATYLVFDKCSKAWQRRRNDTVISNTQRDQELGTLPGLPTINYSGGQAEIGRAI